MYKRKEREMDKEIVHASDASNYLYVLLIKRSDELQIDTACFVYVPSVRVPTFECPEEHSNTCHVNTTDHVM
jgi:hypothetical protein